jgi:type IV secretory pathway VirB2 component (pilin)
MNKNSVLFLFAILGIAFVMPEIAHASVETSLMGIQTKLTRVILPTLSVIGIAWAAISLLSGNEKAKTHVFYAILASAFGFGAQAIVDFISQTVR